MVKVSGWVWLVMFSKQLVRLNLYFNKASLQADYPNKLLLYVTVRGILMTIISIEPKVQIQECKLV